MSPTTPLYLALDQGGQSSRAAVFSSSGDKIAQSSTPCLPETTREGFIEYDPQQVLDSFTLILDQLAEQLDSRVQCIQQAGLACQGSTLVCWHKTSGQALSPAISWQDCRGQALLTHLQTQSPLLSHDNIHAITGLRLSPHYGASKFRWCLENLEAVIRAEQDQQLVISPLASFLLFHLCGRHDNNHPISVDAGHAQRTMLWDIHLNDWSAPLLQSFNLSPTLLPQCKNNHSDFGHLSIGNKKLGKREVPLSICMRDQAAALFAFGHPRTDTLYINMGTGAFIQRITTEQQVPEGLLLSPLFFSDLSKLYAIEGTVNGAGAAMPWLSNEIGEPLTPERLQQALDRVSDPSNPKGADKNLYMINSVAGLGSPYWRADIPPAFSPELSNDEKIVSWLESLVFLLSVNLQLMQSRQPAKRIQISGGLSQNQALCQRLANLSNLTVTRCSDSDSTLRGIAFLSCQRLSNWSDSEEHTDFHPQANPQLRLHQQQWQQAMDQQL